MNILIQEDIQDIQVVSKKYYCIYAKISPSTDKPNPVWGMYFGS